MEVQKDASLTVIGFNDGDSYTTRVGYYDWLVHRKRANPLSVYRQHMHNQIGSALCRDSINDADSTIKHENVPEQ